MAVYTKKYNGSAWVTAPVKKWNGSAWVDAKVSKWNGSTWVQLYPETSVTRSQTLTSGSFNTWRGSKWLNTGTARQGEYSSYGPCAGFLGVNAGNFTGSGNITSISSAKFSGTRGSAGSYNNNQTLYFYRSNVSSGSAANSWTGQFTGTTGGPGAGKTMSNRAISVNAETKNWANKVNSKPYLYIYATGTSNYADIENTFSVTLDYTYAARMVTFEAKDAVALNVSPYTYREVTGRNPYCSMVIHEDEENMTLEEIIRRREDGVVEAINDDDVIDVPETVPWTREYEIFKDENAKDKSLKSRNKIKIEVFNMDMDDEAQFSLDGVEWFTLMSENAEDNYLYGDLPLDFNEYRDFVYVRVIDKKKEVIHTELSIEPKIYIPGQTSGLILPGNIDLETVLPPIESFKA